MFPNDTINHRYMPTLGNGHIGATVYHPWIYLNGLYNGEGGESTTPGCTSMGSTTAREVMTCIRGCINKAPATACVHKSMCVGVVKAARLPITPVINHLTSVQSSPTLYTALSTITDDNICT